MKKLHLPIVGLLFALVACQDVLTPPTTLTPPTGPARVIPPPDDPCALTGACNSHSPDGLVLSSTFTAPYCFASANDADVDGIRDDCESALAAWFRPMLARNNHDAEPRRETYWAVRRKPGTSATVQVFYALGYYRDKGDPSTGLGGHPGDSEFIILEITNYNWISVPSLWTLDKATMSAHWGVSAWFEADHTGTYDYASLEYPSTYRGRPRIWVSWNKHANYRSKSTCNGSAFVDYCDTALTGTTYEDVEVLASANLGSSSHQLVNCVFSRNGFYNNGYWQECLWSTTMAFSGWTGDRNGASTPYGVMLTYYGF